MWTYIIGPFIAFLPARWRAARFDELGVDWPRATALSGLVEGLGAAALLIVWYSVFVTKLGGVIGGAGGDYGGYVGLFSLAMHPLTWVICYFGGEGAVRFLGAVATGESYGTLPLALIAWSRDHRRRPRLVPDEVIARTGTYDLQVASCRAKNHWKHPLTICHQEQFYQVMTTRTVQGSLRPHVYLLRKLPSDQIIKGLEQYDPNAVLREEPQGFFKVVFDEMRRRATR